MRILFLAALMGCGALAATKVVVTVIEPKTGKPVTDLKAADFTALDGDRPRAVETAEFKTSAVDSMLLVDSSLVGQAVQGPASDLIGQLKEKEQMAIVAYHSSADLVQDFTSSQPALGRALAGIKYGNDPRTLDGVYAALDGGFENAVLRRVILLLTTGMEGNSRTNERTVIKLARKHGISIYPIYLSKWGKGLVETLARQTGGAAMNIKDLSNASSSPAARIFEVVRGQYELTITGNLPPTEKFKVEVNRPVKLFVSAMPLD